jgi:hypothetical protein
MRRTRITRRSIAARLAPNAAGLAVLALGAGMPALALAAGGPLNPALVPKDLTGSALPSGFAGELRKTQGENCVFDYDRDGIRDVFLSTHGVGWRLLKGKADGTFVEAERFPATDRHGCTVGDFGGITASGAYTGPDGRPDIYAGIGACRGTCTSPFPNELWLQRPDGTYVPPEQDARSATAKTGNKPNAGSAAAYAFGLADEHGRAREPIAIDVNRDGLMDIFLGNDEGVLYDSRNRLYVNKGGRFEEQPLPGGRSNTEVGSVCSAVADYDGDGWTDLVNCPDEAYGELQVYRNRGGAFQTVTDQLGLGSIPDAKDVEFADLNGDGRLDLVIARYNWLEVRLNRANRFETVDYTRRIDGGTDLAVGDADGDGLKDVYVVLWQNGGGNGDDLLLRNMGTTDDEGGWVLQEVAIPQTQQGNGDTAQAIPNWHGTNRAAFLINNGKWTDEGPWQLVFLTGPSTGPPEEPGSRSGLEEPGSEEPRPKEPGTKEPGSEAPGPEAPGPQEPLAGNTEQGRGGSQPNDTIGEPAPEGPDGRSAGGAGKRPRVALTLAQLRINQRISQAALRRVNALEALVAGRPVEPPKEIRKPPARMALTVGQLRINQRIAQAALRRAVALKSRIDGRPAPKVARRSARSRITLSAEQLRINQRISQAALRRINALADRIAANDFRATTLARHVPRNGSCGCPICRGSAPVTPSGGSGGGAGVTASAAAALAAVQAADANRTIAGVASGPAGVRRVAYSA